MTADKIFAAAFRTGRTPRSNAYQQGVMRSLQHHLEGLQLTSFYRPGTAEADAFWAGVQEGNALAHANRPQPSEKST